VDDREQLGDTLHLVDHDVCRRRPQHHLPEQLRAGFHVPVDVRSQEVDPKRVRKLLLDERGLARPAGAEEEEATFGQAENSRF
jgi:hypothetical protein